MSETAMNSCKIVKFLAEELANRQSDNEKYSLRRFADDLKIDVSILSRILNFKRKLSFETANTILDELHTDVALKHALLLSLADQSYSFEGSVDKSILSDEELDIFGDWEATAVHRALYLKDLPGTAEAIAGKINADHKKVSVLLENFEASGYIEKVESDYRPKGFHLFSEHRSTNTEVLREKNEQRIRKSLEALNSDLSDTEFASMCFAMPRSKIQEAKKRIQSFSLSLASFLDEGEKEEVAMLNVQFFTLKKR